MSPLKTMNDIIKARGWDDAQKMLGQPIAAIARHIQKRLTDQMKRSQPADADSRDFSDELTFTRLQEKAFNHPSLWGSWAGADDFRSRNLVIQGTTSAGKTDFRAADRGYVGTWKNRAGAGSTEIHGP